MISANEISECLRARGLFRKSEIEPPLPHSRTPASRRDFFLRVSATCERLFLAASGHVTQSPEKQKAHASRKPFL